MKRIQTALGVIILLLIFAVSFSSCKSKTEKAQQALTEYVAAARLKFPQQVNDNISIVDCAYKDNVLTLKYDVDQKTYKKINAEKSGQNVLYRLKSNLVPRSFSQKLAATNASLKCVFVSRNDSTSISFTPEELK